MKPILFWIALATVAVVFSIAMLLLLVRSRCTSLHQNSMQDEQKKIPKRMRKDQVVLHSMTNLSDHKMSKQLEEDYTNMCFYLIQRN